ncbi:hydrogenase maturation nickel metallochaperone HypA [Synechococcus sp. 1G10]|uniref:hydrogenase maturation nickel metallochaperone HypA n=1 Tax=Synechococcus sp. 1G10 TaxID=2025605 RepID=UPI000B986740|nr:hydrogenase maturation nickel metallochaperone HypA [Synechococcus sp. 1G10]
MHELSLMEAVRDLALEQAGEHHARRISTITLRIGSLAGVEPDALRFAFDVVMAGTLGEGAALVIEDVQAHAFCDVCQQTFPAHDGVCECPDCGAISRDLVQGRELQLASLDLDCDDDPLQS